MSLTDAWMARAACQGMPADLFFGTDGERGDRKKARESRAKAVCGRCDVAALCLTYATAEGMRDGIWGATSPEDRDAAARERRRARRRVQREKPEAPAA